jgi:hypothetical protein
MKIFFPGDLVLLLVESVNPLRYIFRSLGKECSSVYLSVCDFIRDRDMILIGPNMDPALTFKWINAFGTISHSSFSVLHGFFFFGKLELTPNIQYIEFNSATLPGW